jgi:hypothetical protein
LLYVAVACLVTGVATWFAYDLTRAVLGTVGGLLAGLVAAMFVGATFYVVGAVMWGTVGAPTGSRPPSAVDTKG